jgi:hypothetical protein
VATLSDLLLQSYGTFLNTGLFDIVCTFTVIICLQYECCGVHNYTDWMGVYDVNVPTSIPDSCCGYPDCGESGSAAAWRIVSPRLVCSSVKVIRLFCLFQLSTCFGSLMMTMKTLDDS